MFSIDVGTILGGFILNHYTILMVAPPEVTGILANCKGVANETSSNVIMTHPCATHYICETMKWEPSWLGL
jgi:hypothetical protein